MLMLDLGWTGIHRKYVDEVGAMNVFFVIDGEIHTPSLEGILPLYCSASRARPA